MSMMLTHHMTAWRLRSAAWLAFAVLAGPGAEAQAPGQASNQAPRAQEHTGSLVPGSVRAEHEEIQADLLRAARVTGPVSLAARELQRVLQPHFEREEQIALPPLGLLRPLSNGDRPDRAMAERLAAMSDSLRAELPRMLTEHAQIRSAVIRLEEAGRREPDSAAMALAVRLQLHARNEEEILYPAAVLVAELLRRPR